LYWLGLDGRLMAASIELQAAGVRPGRPQPLFQLPGSFLPTTPVVPGVRFQPALDGRRFLVYEPEGVPPEGRMAVVENWAARLRK
jgi:hypothetical protein